MLNSMKPLLVAAFFAVATNLSAQEATTTEAPSDADATETPADLSMGSEVTAAPATADENAVGTP